MEFAHEIYREYSDNRILKIPYEYSNPLLILNLKPNKVIGWPKRSAEKFYHKKNSL